MPKDSASLAEHWNLRLKPTQTDAWREVRKQEPLLHKRLKQLQKSLNMNKRSNRNHEIPLRKRILKNPLVNEDEIIESKELIHWEQRLYLEIDDKRKQELEEEQWKNENRFCYQSRAASSFFSDASRSLNSRCKSNLFMSKDKKECIETDLDDFAAKVTFAVVQHISEGMEQKVKSLKLVSLLLPEELKILQSEAEALREDSQLNSPTPETDYPGSYNMPKQQKRLNEIDARIQIIAEKIAENQAEMGDCNNKLLGEWYQDLYPDLLQYDDYERREIALNTIDREIEKLRQFMYEYLDEIPEAFSSVEILINEMLTRKDTEASRMILMARHHIYDFEGEFDSIELQRPQDLDQKITSIDNKWKSRAEDLLNKLSKVVPHENQIRTVILRTYPSFESNLQSPELCPIDPTLAEHALYLERIHSRISAIMMNKVDSICPAKKEQVIAEQVKHQHFVVKRSEQYLARKSLLEAILSKINNLENLPKFIWIKGLPCMGKTTLVSKLSVEIKKRHPDLSQILRIANLTSESESLAQVFQSIIHQMTGSMSGNHKSFEELTEILRDLCGSMSKPILVIIDGLENFMEAKQNPAFAHRWLENFDHVSNVCLIITSQNSRPKSLAFFEEVQMEPLEKSDAEICFSVWKNKLRVICPLEEDLDSHVGSTLQMLAENNHKCDPLSLRILLYTCVANEGIALVSRKLDMYRSAEKSIATFFARMERELSQKKSQTILGSMAASRHGLTHNELVTLASLSLNYIDRKPPSHTSEDSDENSSIIKSIKNSFNCFPDVDRLKKIDSMVTETDIDFVFKFYLDCCDLVLDKCLEGAKVFHFSNRIALQVAKQRYVVGSRGKLITRMATLVLSSTKFLPMNSKRTNSELAHFASQTDLILYLEKCLFNETWIKECLENSVSLFNLITDIFCQLNQCFQVSGMHDSLESDESTPQYLKMVLDDPYLRTLMLILTSYGSQLQCNSDLLVHVLRLTLRNNLKNIELPKKPSKNRELFEALTERVESESQFKLVECPPLPLCSDAEYMFRFFDNALLNETLICNSSYAALVGFQPLIKALCFDQSGKRYFCSFGQILELRDLQTRKVLWTKRLQEPLSQIRILSQDALLVETEKSKALWVLNWRKESIFVLDNGDLKKTIKNEFAFDKIDQTVISIRQKSMKLRLWTLNPSPKLIFENTTLRSKLREKVLELHHQGNLTIEDEPNGKKIISSKIRDILSKDILISAMEPMVFLLALRETRYLWLVTLNPQADETMTFKLIELPASTSICQMKLTPRRLYIAARMTNENKKISFRDLKTRGCIIFCTRENEFKEITILEGTPEMFQSKLELFTNQTESTLLCCAVRKEIEKASNEMSIWNLESGDFKMVPDSIVEPENFSPLAPLALTVFDLGNMVYSLDDKIRLLNPMKCAKPVPNQVDRKSKLLSGECSIIFEKYFVTLTQDNSELAIWDPDEPQEPIFSYKPALATLKWGEDQYWNKKDLLLLRGTKIVALGNLAYSEIVPTCK
ncbi:hypothetical protein Ciccas_003337 [Cichlidogyrus casuarinus]|uniref:NACHT domain-containing protein n=1 Tax=Cichlidogyrus casuarinus TaxID=1844966 RepID=A0ABD2QEN0_9PLAT